MDIPEITARAKVTTLVSGAQAGKHDRGRKYPPSEKAHLILRAVRSTASRRMTANDDAAYLKIIPARVGEGVAAGGAAGEIEKVSQVFQPAGRFWLSNSK